MTTEHSLALLDWYGILRPVPGGPEQQFAFRHAVSHEAVYATLLRDDMRRLHLATGETLEELYPDRLSELSPELSRHFLAAGNDRKALKYSTMAGAAALKIFANAEAEGHYREAVRLAQTPDECAPLLTQLGEALFNQSRFDEAIQAWRQAIDQFQALGDYDRMARMYARAARAAGGGGLAGNMLQALELCWDGLDAMAGQPESSGLAMLLHEMGRACYFSGLHDDAREYAGQALAMATRLQDLATQADTMATLWGTMLYPPQESAAGLKRAADLALALEKFDTLSRVYHNLGSLLGFILGDMKGGIEHLLRAASVDRETGHHAEEFYSLRVASSLVWMAGDLAQLRWIVARQRALIDLIHDPQREKMHVHYMEAALAWIPGDAEEARHILQGVSLEDLPFGGRIGAADLLIELGQIDEADGLLCHGLESDTEMVGVTIRTQLSQVRTSQGNFAEARRLLVDAREIPSEFGLMDEMYLAHAEAHLAQAEGRWPEALAAFAALVEVEARGGMTWYQARSLSEWAEVLIEAGQHDEAAARLRESLALFEKLGAEAYAAQVREQLKGLNR